MYPHAKRSHTHVKGSVVYVRVQWVIKNTKITQHALKVSRVIRMLRLDTIWKKKKKKKRSINCCLRDDVVR